MTIPRMRTISETIAEIKAIDPMTAVTPNCIRTLCKSGKIRCVFTGKKLLVDCYIPLKQNTVGGKYNGKHKQTTE